MRKGKRMENVEHRLLKRGRAECKCQLINCILTGVITFGVHIYVYVDIFFCLGGLIAIVV